MKMKEKHVLVRCIFLLSILIFSILPVYAQEPKQTEDPTIIDMPPPKIEDPFLPHQEEQKCEPVRPDELEGVSGEELIQRWLNYAKCKNIDMNQIPDSSYTIDYRIWFMSSHSITLSKGLDPELEEYVENVPHDHLAPVIIQPKRATSIAEMIELINLGLRYYRGSALANGAYLTFIPASSINEIANKPYIAGVTLFKPSFKYTKIPATEDKTETHVFTIEETNPYHESDLKRVDVDVLNYDDSLKLYVVKMSASQYDDVANLEWTKLITVVPGSILESALVEATDKADNYIVGKSPTQDNLIIYAIIGIILIIVVIFLGVCPSNS